MLVQAVTPIRPLLELLPTDAPGEYGLRFNFHPGQVAAWNSLKRFVLVLAGTQGGKTSFGPIWLWREMQICGPGDYLVVAPTFALLEKKALPEFRLLFEDYLQLGRYNGSSHIFTLSHAGCYALFGDRYDPLRDPPTRILFGYAANPDSLESATAKAAWLDEAGQKIFKYSSFQAIIRRLSLARRQGWGRILLTTTPYDLGWIKQKLWDPWADARKEGQRHKEIDVIRFESTMNPAFPREEFEWARANLPPWKFDLFYRALFTRPAGQIYDSFIARYAPTGHIVKPFNVPSHWPRFLGLDFGGVHTAGTLYALDPNSSVSARKYYLYREYLAGNRTAHQHVQALKAGEPYITLAAGGSWSEIQWRSEFGAAGLDVQRPPVNEVEVGINRVYAAHVASEIMVFDTCTKYLKEKDEYSREVDDLGEPLEAIADKNEFHLMDSERYIWSFLRQDTPETPRSHSFAS